VKKQQKNYFPFDPYFWSIENGQIENRAEFGEASVMVDDLEENENVPLIFDNGKS